MSQPIAIVGASARAAAASAIRAGFQPVTADLFADADLRRVATATRITPYPDGLLDWLRTIEPPAWMYTGALENYPELVDQMAWIAPLWGNPGDVLERVRSPLELARVLRTAGLLFPETRTTSEGLPRDGTWLAKTYQGASGSGVRVHSGEPGARSKEQSNSLPEPRSLHPCSFQQRIPGIPAAAAFVAMDNRSILLGVTRQLIGESWLGTDGFRYVGSIGLLPIQDATRETIKRIGQVLTERFELSGLFGVDFILDRDQVWTLEVNPRYTASVEVCERATGIHALAAHAAAWPESTINNLQDSHPIPKLVHGKAIAFANRDIVISQAFADMALAEALRKPWPTLADVSPAGTHIEAGRPIVTVFADGATPDDVELRLRQRVAEIEQRVYADLLNSE